MINKLLVSALLFVTIHTAWPQKPQVVMLSMDEAVKMSMANHPCSKNAALKVEIAKQKKQSATDPGLLKRDYPFDRNNLPINDQILETFQNFGTPVKLTDSEQNLLTRHLSADVKKAYTNWIFQHCKWDLLKQEAEQYNSLMMFIDELRPLQDSTQEPQRDKIHETTDSTKDDRQYERSSIETRYAEVQNENFQAEQEYKIVTNQLQQLLFYADSIAPTDSEIELYAIKTVVTGADKFLPASYLSYFQSLLDLNNTQIKEEQSRFFPRKAKIAKALLNQKILENEIEYQKFSLNKKIENLKIQLDQYFVSVTFFRENALENAALEEKTADKRYKNHKTDCLSYLRSRDHVLQTRLAYLEKLKQYNITAIQLEYYIN